MKQFLLKFSLILGFVLTSTRMMAAPVISHEQVRVAPRSKPLNIVARVSSPSDPVQSVLLHYAISDSASPVDVEMSATGVGVYYGTIPANYLTAKGTIRYYLEAVTRSGDREETRWFTISIQDPGETIPGSTPPPPEKERAGWVLPTVLIGGGALAVAGAIALSDSGGGGSDNADSNNNGGGNNGGGDITGRVITRSASDTANASGVELPRELTVDASDEIGSRSVSSIKVDVIFNPVDGFEESYEVLYKGNPVITSGAIFLQTQRSVTLDGSSNAITMRVLTSGANEQSLNQFNWLMTVTYFLDE